jgi:hypothetical protein
VGGTGAVALAVTARGDVLRSEGFADFEVDLNID